MWVFIFPREANAIAAYYSVLDHVLKLKFVALRQFSDQYIEIMMIVKRNVFNHSKRPIANKFI